MVEKRNKLCRRMTYADHVGVNDYRQVNEEGTFYGAQNISMGKVGKVVWKDILIERED